MTDVVYLKKNKREREEEKEGTCVEK